jgi:hypothetical protein
MIDALIAGQRDPAVLADPAMGRLRAKTPDLVRALDGRFETHHAVHLRQLLDTSTGSRPPSRRSTTASPS